jgi:hypothetical protein
MFGPLWKLPSPRCIVVDGKLIDGVRGKALHELDSGAGMLMSRDGKYLVRLTQKPTDKKMAVEVWGLDGQK